MRYCRSTLIVRMACGRSHHHIWSGKSLWVLDITAIKCSLKFLMACSDEFLWWMRGGTNWNFSFPSLMQIFRTLGHALYSICRCGFSLCCSISCVVLGETSLNPCLMFFQRFCMDGVGVITIGNQDICVSIAGCNWKPSCLVRVKFFC